jgi:hypothetical protein
MIPYLYIPRKDPSLAQWHHHKVTTCSFTTSQKRYHIYVCVRDNSCRYALIANELVFLLIV